ncbi:ATP-binding protein [Herbidospora yilanensis]|uniref:ATP-binding protein n=1 Tax=Herbidospora yilanensis TaxID=354426 RepID=UPI000785C1B8|nr:LuxR C-terminal-related transcriptional regulator [Herbidospora yilanensis]
MTTEPTPREREILRLVGERLQNREIARRLHLSERTVESHVSALLRKLGGENRLALVAHAERLRRRDLPAALSSFVGRESEIPLVAELLAAHRLVTLTGPAGTGKTRLALHVAATLPQAVLVDLAPLAPGDDVAAAFGDVLRGAAGRTLVVDNCEHVQVAPLLTGLLRSGSGVRVLATSHGPLGVPGERVCEIAPLPVPPESSRPEEVLSAASARLFADRAASSSPGFAVTDDNARDVARICRRLDGLPLALELAAARVRAFTPAELVGLLDSRFTLLTDGPVGRHRTLEEALRWSYDLLHADERLLLARLSVFPGEFDHDTAADVLAYEPLDRPAMSRLLPRLLDRSLVSRRRAGETTRYRLLDSVRQFAAARLGDDAAEARDRHADHHLTTAVSLVAALRGADQARAHRWFNRHWPDLRQAVRHTDDPWPFLAGVGTAWEIIGARADLFDWLADPVATVPALTTAAIVHCFQDVPKALAFARRAAELAESPDDRAVTALALGWCLMYADPTAALPHLEDAATRYAETGDTWHRALALTALGQAAGSIGPTAEAADLFGGLGDQVKRANALNHMALRAIDAGVRLDEAAAWLTEAERLAEASDNDHERLHAQVFRAALRDPEEARDDYARLLPEFRRIGDLRCADRCLRGLAES